MVINDPAFVHALLTQFTTNGLAGLAAVSVEVREGGDLDRIRIELRDEFGPLVTLGYHPLRGVAVLAHAAYMTGSLDLVNDDDQIHAQLSRVVRGLLHRHGVEALAFPLEPATFVELLANSAEYRESVWQRAVAGELPADVECWIWELAYGPAPRETPNFPRPSTSSEWTQ